MERYFLGNNTAYGFRSFYADELRDKDKVILLKGGPGTGKSTLLKKIAKESVKRGYSHEEWYCSGDPYSLDGVYIKDINTVVMDATSPHATDPVMPVVKEIIVNLADCLDADVLLPNKAMIKELIKDKKYRFMRAYQHLKCALCHFNNELELMQEGVDEQKIRRYAAAYFECMNKENAARRRMDNDNIGVKRKLFTHAISSDGESEYYDHLRNREIIRVKGNALVKKIFFGQLEELLSEGLILRMPLDPSVTEGIATEDKAVTGEVGFYEDKASEILDLGMFEGKYERAEAEEEYVARKVSEAGAKHELNSAKACHAEIEKYYIAAMDYGKLGVITQNVFDETFR